MPVCTFAWISACDFNCTSLADWLGPSFFYCTINSSICGLRATFILYWTILLFGMPSHNFAVSLSFSSDLSVISNLASYTKNLCPFSSSDPYVLPWLDSIITYGADWLNCQDPHAHRVLAGNDLGVGSDHVVLRAGGLNLRKRLAIELRLTL